MFYSIVFSNVVCVIAGERADARQARKAVPKLETDELRGLYDFSPGVFWTYKLNQQG